MRMYILALKDKISFAQRILEDIPDLKIISRVIDDEKITEINTDRKKEIARADIVLAIIDEKSVSNIMFNEELQLALMERKSNRNKLLLPIVLDNTAVPEILESMLYIRCNSESNEDLEKTKLKIMNTMEQKKRSIKKQNLLKQKHQSKMVPMVFLTIAIEILTILFLIISPTGKMSNARYLNEYIIIITVAASIMTLLISYFSVVFSSIEKRQHENDEKEIESYSNRLKRAMVTEETKQYEQIGLEKEKEIDALGRMMINLEDIKEFYTWSQKQAKVSFILASIMCVAGLVLMIVTVILTVIFKLSFGITITSVIGGVVTELIAGTALVVYQNSLSQLNHYHKALHEDERFLSSVNLLGKFSTIEAKDNMLQEIIRSEIQMNLSEIIDDKDTKLDKPRIKHD